MAFELRRDGSGLVDLQVTKSVVAVKTVAVLTFVGPDIIGGSLADGSYTLTARADQIHDRFGQELDGDGNGSAGGDRVDNSSRLFGDADGQVDHSDRNVIRSTFKTNAGEVGYLWYFDFDGDNRQFNRRFGQS